MNIVYKITRSDGKEYVGISKQFAYRIQQHKRSKRFEIGIANISILAECETYEEAENLETYYISVYDTYNNGLNETLNGKGNHNSPKFNTKEYKFSEASRKKMSENHWSKRGFVSGMKGKNHTSETKLSWSNKRKGKVWGPTKIDADDIRKSYGVISFSLEDALPLIKKTSRDIATLENMYEMKMTSGHPLTYDVLFRKHFAKKYSVTTNAIRRLMNK